MSNAQKGKVVVPNVLSFGHLDNANAAVASSFFDKELGTMYINKEVFSLDKFDDFVNKYLKTDDGTNAFVRQVNGKYKPLHYYERTFQASADDGISKLLDKFYADSNSLSNKEKLDLMLSFKASMSSVISLKKDNPYMFLSRFQQEFKNRGINYNLEDFENKTKDEIKNYIDQNISPILSDRRNFIAYDWKLEDRFKTVYHKMGHLQDINKNQDKILVKMDFLKALRTKLNPRIARLATKTEDEIVNLLSTDSGRRLLEKEAPLVYDFFTNKETQATAAEVSEYATHSIGEFIAETYAKIIKNEPISEKVMNLYNKYNGPTLP